MSVASPVGPGGLREAIDTFSRGQYIGPLSELQELVAPLVALKPIKTTFRTTILGHATDVRLDGGRASLLRGHLALLGGSTPSPGGRQGRGSARQVSRSRCEEQRLVVVAGVDRRRRRGLRRRARHGLRAPQHAHDAACHPGAGAERASGHRGWAGRLDQAGRRDDRAAYRERELPELPEPGHPRPEAPVPRGELPAARRRQDEVRPARRLRNSRASPCASARGRSAPAPAQPRPPPRQPSSTHRRVGEACRAAAGTPMAIAAQRWGILSFETASSRSSANASGSRVRMYVDTAS
jgi:hypothetical protein